MNYTPRNYGPTDNVFGANAPKEATVMEFWQWAFGDLSNDDIKGIFAEWLITKILELPSDQRISWANSDLITSDGIRIEVKTSSYWQSWKLINEDGSPKDLDEMLDRWKPKSPGQIRFSGLMARDATGESKNSNTAFKSDLYVFCFQHESNPQSWNALDMSQWEFYVFDVKDLANFAGKSVSLKRLREHQHPLDAVQLVTKTREIIERRTK